MTDHLELYHGLVAEIDQMLDDGTSDIYHRHPLAQDWARVAKAAEEAGEAVSALISWTGQNPRKKRNIGDYDKLLDELADVALAGIYALQHFTKDTATTDTLIRERLQYHYDRLKAARPTT